ncbi:MAG: Bax inhibitor-1 family protein, partial [Planctomycetota bacterium]
GGFAIDAALDERLAFIRRTYATLLIQLIGVALSTSLMIKTGLVQKLFPGGLLVGFLGIMFIMPRMIVPTAKRGVQTAGAAMLVAFYGLLLSPLVMVAPPGVLVQAGILTGCVFGGLTLYVFVTKKDFNFLGGMLNAVLWILIGVGLISFFFGGFGSAMNMAYSGGLVLLFSGYVLYNTSNIMKRYPTNAHIAASIALLIDVISIFYVIALLLMGSRD